jgi:hypothetical protein
MNQENQIHPCDITKITDKDEAFSLINAQIDWDSRKKAAVRYQWKQKHDAESIQRCPAKGERKTTKNSNITNIRIEPDAGRRMLTFALSSAVSHNRKNLAHSAKNKNPDKLTVAEKEALQAVKVSVWQKCSDKSDKSWEAYLAKKAYQQRSIKLVDVWQHCSDTSDNSWSNYVWSKDNVWKYCSKTKSWTKTIDCA